MKRSVRTTHWVAEAIDARVKARLLSKALHVAINKQIVHVAACKLFLEGKCELRSCFS